MGTSKNKSGQRPEISYNSTPAEYEAVWRYYLDDSARQAAEARQKANDLREQRQALRAQREADCPAIVGIGETYQILYEIQPVRGLHIRLCELRAELAENLHARLQEAFDSQRTATAMETITPTD